METVYMKDDETDGHSTDRMSKGDTSKSSSDVTDHPEKDKKQGDSNKVKFRHSFQMRTMPEGYNSGRQYIIQARSDEERQKIVADLTKLSKIAIDKHLAKSQFRKTQVRRALPSFHTRVERPPHHDRPTEPRNRSRVAAAGGARHGRPATCRRCGTSRTARQPPPRSSLAAAATPPPAATVTVTTHGCCAHTAQP